MEKLAKQILENLFGSWEWPKNWVIKLISLCFAIFLWYFVAGESNVDMNVNIPVEIINLPSNLIISNDYKKSLEVSVTGPRSLIRNLDSSHVSRTVDLAKATSGPVVIKNTPKSVHLPWGVKVNRVNPAEFIVQLDELIEKKIPIQAITSGKISPGYKLISVMLEPANITVTAPKAIIADLSTINTKPLPIDQLTSSTMAHTSLDLSPKIAEIIGDPVVTASIIIEERQEHLTISQVPIMLTEAQKHSGLHLAPSKVKILVTIPYSLAQKTKNSRKLIKSTLITTNLKPGINKVPVKVTPMDRVKILEIDPPQVTVNIPAPKPPAPTSSTGKTKE